MTEIPDFPLKTFFMRSEAGQAEGNLSASFAEPLPLAELLALEEGAEDAFREIGLGYPGLYGSAPLRQRVAARYPGLGEDQAIMTCGTDDAIATLFLALVEPGQRVVVQSPCYTSLASVADWRGAAVVPWQAREEDGWAPDLDELARLLEGAAMLVVNLPHNPTGFVPVEAWLDRLCEIAAGQGVILVADEIYHGLPYEGAPKGGSGGSRVLGRYERTVSLSGMSKTFGLPGLRCGWLVSASAAILDPVRKLRLHFNGMIGRPNEFLAELALRHETEILARNTTIMEASFADLDAFMARHANLLAWTPPRAGVNAYARWLGPGNTDDLSQALFAHAKVLLAPSSRFEAGDRHLRLGFGVRTLTRDLERLDSLLEARFAA